MQTRNYKNMGQLYETVLSLNFFLSVFEFYLCLQNYICQCYVVVFTTSFALDYQQTYTLTKIWGKSGATNLVNKLGEQVGFKSVVQKVD